MTGSWRDRDGGFRTERLANGWLVDDLRRWSGSASPQHW
jgi:hypothetical protein